MKNFKSNIPQSIKDKVGINLHNIKNHPIEIVKRKIFDYFDDNFEKFDNLNNPIVSTKKNFDALLIEHGHVCRSPQNTYYFSEDEVLRTHMTCHTIDFLCQGKKQVIAVGQVFRRDSVDKNHNNSFTQLEGVVVLDNDNINPEEELKKTLSGLVNFLFANSKYKFNVDKFPFTHPSFEIECEYENSLIEILGCGVIKPEIMSSCGLDGKHAIAWGIGLDRIVKLLFKIDDIRILYSDSHRFLLQFSDGKIRDFIPFSNHPEHNRDIAFWIPETYDENRFFEIVRDFSDNTVQEVKLLDKFVHPKTNKTSKCYRITYLSHDKDLTNEEINEKQSKIKEIISQELLVELR